MICNTSSVIFLSKHHGLDFVARVLLPTTDGPARPEVPRTTSGSRNVFWECGGMGSEVNVHQIHQAVFCIVLQSNQPSS